MGSEVKCSRVEKVKTSELLDSKASSNRLLYAIYHRVTYPRRLLVLIAERSGVRPPRWKQNRIIEPHRVIK